MSVILTYLGNVGSNGWADADAPYWGGVQTSPNRTTSQSAGRVPRLGTSFHSVCQLGMPRVSSWWSMESRSCSVGGDDRLDPLDGFVDGVQHSSDRPLLRQGVENRT